MKPKYHYSNVTDAINKLRSQGFNTDFNLRENCIVCTEGEFQPEDFQIVDVYRYEGNSDPGDEATVYAIESTSGVKGILVTGYGASHDFYSTAILEKLALRDS